MTFHSPFHYRQFWIFEQALLSLHNDYVGIAAKLSILDSLAVEKIFCRGTNYVQLNLKNRKCPRKGKGKGKRRILNNKSKTVEFFFFPFHVVFFGEKHCFGLSEDLEQHCEQHCFERWIFSRFIFSLIPRGMWIENWPLLQLISRKISPPCRTLSISSFDIFQNNLQDVPLN